MSLGSIALIIPYYNEIKRFDCKKLVELSKQSENLLDIYLVDDGSQDSLSNQIAKAINESVLINAYQIISRKNLGKANAIRFGYNLIADSGREYSYFGFTDADFSTPPEEIVRVAKWVLTNSEDFVFGVRLPTKKNLIETSKFRSTQGKFFTKIVKFILGTPFKDSQCGLKFMKNGSEMHEIFSIPFDNSWLVDLEIMCRAKNKREIKVMELVLHKWTHFENSKTGIRDIPKVAISLFKLRFKYGRMSSIKATTLFDN